MSEIFKIGIKKVHPSVICLKRTIDNLHVVFGSNLPFYISAIHTGIIV